MASKIYFRTALTGGGNGALDAIQGTDLNAGDAALTITSDNKFYVHRVCVGTVTENPPYIIIPDSNADNKYWNLVFASSLENAEPLFVQEE